MESRCYGLVAPGYTTAEVVGRPVLGGEAEFPGADMSTKLKLMGVDVASFGDAMATSPGALEAVLTDPPRGRTPSWWSDDAKMLVGGVLVGDASGYACCVRWSVVSCRAIPNIDRARRPGDGPRIGAAHCRTTPRCARATT